MSRSRIALKISVLLIMLAVSAYSAYIFINDRKSYDELVPSAAFSKMTMLSDYNPNLLGSASDSEIYFFDSGVPGGTLFVMGGTHPDEVAGILSCYILIENIKVDKGRVIVLPVANHSAYLYPTAGQGYPSSYTLMTKSGERSFNIGGRRTSPLEQWPDPPVFIQYPSRQSLSYEESRDINRNYPGTADGSMTKQVCFAIMRLLEEESVDLAFDLHEASVTYPVNYTYIAPEKSLDIALLSQMLLNEEGIPIRTSASTENSKGYSHYEWGNIEGVYPFLIEVPTPVIDRIHGPMSEDLVVSGADDFLYSLGEKGFTAVPYSKDGYSISERCGIHLSAVMMAVDVSSSLLSLDSEIAASWPCYDDLVRSGAGFFLH